MAKSIFPTKLLTKVRVWGAGKDPFKRAQVDAFPDLVSANTSKITILWVRDPDFRAGDNDG